VAGYFCGRQVYTLARFSPAASRRHGSDHGYAAMQHELARMEELAPAEERHMDDVELAG